MSSVTLEADRASRSADEGLFADVFGFTSTVGLGLGSGIKYNLLFSFVAQRHFIVHNSVC